MSIVGRQQCLEKVEDDDIKLKNEYSRITFDPKIHGP